jgi:hypothetical protein
MTEDARYHLAQFNVAALRFPLDDPRMAGFVALLKPVNALADGTPGFVWRLVEEGEPDATGMRPAGEDVIVNFSVWESSEALWDFVYRSGHLETMRRRREWFRRHVDAHLVLWWIPAGHVPTRPAARERPVAARVHVQRVLHGGGGRGRRRRRARGRVTGQPSRAAAWRPAAAAVRK